MTTEVRPRIKITYATLRADNEELHALYERGVDESRANLGAHHRNYVEGRWVDGSAGVFEARSPIDRDMLIGTFAKGDRSDVRAAIAAARRAAPAWRHTPWQERLAVLRKAAELISERGATHLRSAPLERPGLYRVLQGGQLRSTFAVNPDPRESDLQAMPDEALVRGFPGGRAQVMHAGADLARRVREARYGRELWSWFIVLALLLLVAETILARWGMEEVKRAA